MGEKAIVFISCGQFTTEEKQLGAEVLALVNAMPGLQGYFAEDQTSAQGVAEHILQSLNRAGCFIAIMHRRGQVTTPSGKHTRASVWIEQEIAIVSFLQVIRAGDFPVAAYVQKGIHREGLRDKILLNPKEFDTNAEVLSDLKDKLATWAPQPRHSSEPRVAIYLGYKDVEITQDVHTYRTMVMVKNDGDIVLDGYVVEIRFPKLFIPPFSKVLGEDVAATTGRHRVFRVRATDALYPGVTRESWKLSYQVTEDLYSKYGHSPEFQDAVVVRVYSDNRLAGETSKPFAEMQKF